jgi:Amt family ammonium transporter
VSPFGSIFIGFIAGAVCAFAIGLKNKFGFDDSLDVVGVHFVGGWTGTILLAFFSTKGTNPAYFNGILYGSYGDKGGFKLLLHQVEVAAAVTAFSFILSYIIAFVIGLVMKTRVDEEDEYAGLDISIHGESAYDFGPLGGVGAGDYVPSAATKASVEA